MKDTKEIKEKGVGGGGISRTRIGGRVLVGSQVSARTRISCYAINEDHRIVSPKMPTDNQNRPIAEWTQLAAFDTALECEDSMEMLGQGTGKKKLKVSYKRLRCIPADALYPHTQPKK